MREMEFKLERKELLDEVKPGVHFDVKEYKIANSYYYVMGRSYAMSANFSVLDRLKSGEGTVKEISDTPKGYFVTMEFDE
ncbi:MAG: hypothetical protein IJT32_00865 [Lachnospiraceae bacterium]|nr:hypothetical protein [Lachnospiraceae bacterium]